MMTYIAHVSTNFWCSMCIITPAHQVHKSFLKPSQLPGEYIASLVLQNVGSNYLTIIGFGWDVKHVG